MPAESCCYRSFPTHKLSCFCQGSTSVQRGAELASDRVHQRNPCGHPELPAPPREPEPHPCSSITHVQPLRLSSRGIRHALALTLEAGHRSSHFDRFQQLPGCCSELCPAGGPAGQAEERGAEGQSVGCDGTSVAKSYPTSRNFIAEGRCIFQF